MPLGELSPLTGEKILITGVTGAIALPAARALVQENEVIGAARFTNPQLLAEVEEAGIQVARVDFEKNDYDAIPEDVSIILHYAYTRRPSGEFQDAIQVNAIAAGHVMHRCQNAKAALIVSAATLYSAHEDPFHPYHEHDDIGYVRAPWGPSSPVSKVTLESTVRFCAQAFNLPTTIVRPSAPYGTRSDVASVVVDAVLEGKPVYALHDPQPYSVLHIDDMIDQIPALLGAAAVPATLLNWASDEIVTTQEMARQAEVALGRPATIQIMQADGVAKGAVVDTTRIRETVGPCRRKFKDAFAEICRERLAASPEST